MIRIEDHQGLVRKVASRYRGIPFEDLVQEGNIGLMRAAEKFDPDRGTAFSTCAWQWIRQSISRALDTQLPGLCTPRGKQGDRPGIGSLDAPRRSCASLADVLEDKRADSPFEAAQIALLSEEIDRALGTLSRREREIVRLRFGLADGYEYTLEECGRIFRRTRERIRQIQAEALARLRIRLRAA